MCDPFTLALMIGGTAASAIGGGLTAREAQKNDQREADARNRVLKETMARNDRHAAANREQFLKRVGDSEAQPATEQLVMAQGQAEQGISSNLAETAIEAPLAGDAPKVVKDAMKGSLSDSFRKSVEQAKQMGALTGYGATSRDNAIADASLGNEINTNNSFVRGNMSVMPYLQDYASIQARKPSNGLGQILQAAGGMAVQAAGAKGGVKKPAPHPMYG